MKKIKVKKTKIPTRKEEDQGEQAIILPFKIPHVPLIYNYNFGFRVLIFFTESKNINALTH